MSVLAAENNTRTIRTLIVDDAPLMRRVIHDILSKNDAIEVVGTAVNGQECLEKIPELKPDVVTLDIDMPVMNGITTVKNIMVRHQIPIVIISSLVQDGYFAFEALRLGVMDFVPKPSRVTPEHWANEEELVRMRVRAASGMQVNRMRRVRRKKRADILQETCDEPPPAVVVMGTTLAGPNTIMHIATKLPPDFQGAIITLQEIHPRILAPFCSYFNEISPLEVVPVTGSFPLTPGRIYVGSTFMGLQIAPAPTNSGEMVLQAGEAVESPIDMLFESAAHHFEENACGVLLTGVGTDGADGLRAIQERGGLTMAQEQDCCVYPNLVENALREGVVNVIMTTQGIATRLKSWIQDRG